MNITVIEPLGPYPEEIEIRQRYLESVCSPNTMVRFVPMEGVTSVDDASSRDLIPSSFLKEVNVAKNNADAVVYFCFGDPGIEEARYLTDIPIIGTSESVLRLAYLMADRIGIITPGPESGLAPGESSHNDNSCSANEQKPYERLIAKRVVFKKGFNLPVLEFIQRKEEVETKFIELGMKAVENGAELIIPFCCAILPALGIGSAAKLSKILGVPVLDSSSIALKEAEFLVNTKMSKRKAL